VINKKDFENKPKKIQTRISANIIITVFKRERKKTPGKNGIDKNFLKHSQCLILY